MPENLLSKQNLVDGEMMVSSSHQVDKAFLKLGQLLSVRNGLPVAIMSLFFGVGIWQILATNGVLEPLFFSSPIAIFRETIIQFGKQQFWSATGESAYEFAVGFTMSIVIGIPLGLTAGWYRGFGYLIDPWLNFLYAIPRIALVPIIVLWFGIGMTPIIVLVFLSSVFDIVMNVEQGARHIEPRFVKVARTFQASELFIFKTIVIPATTRSILVGIRLGLGKALIGVIIGQMFAGTSGLGQVISLASQQLNAGRVLFVSLFMTLAALLLTELIRWIERINTPWQTETKTPHEFSKP